MTLCRNTFTHRARRLASAWQRAQRSLLWRISIVALIVPILAKLGVDHLRWRLAIGYRQTRGRPPKWWTASVLTPLVLQV